LPRAASRIVSLVPSATLTLHALGAADRLFGRTDYDTESGAADLPSVGGGLDPYPETIVALLPAQVVRVAGEQDPRTQARLDDLGIPHVAGRPDRVDDVYRTVEILGRVTGRPSAADSLTDHIRGGLAGVEHRVGALPRRSIAYVLGGSPPWVAGPGTYIHELITLAGGDNVFSDLPELYVSVSPEQIRSRRIEVVLVSGYDTFDRSLTPDAVVRDVPADVEVPGPGIVEAAWQLAELIHGPLAGASRPDRAAPDPDPAVTPGRGPSGGS